jgi:predicted DNA-binding ArsR family transcriptional regulator
MKQQNFVSINSLNAEARKTVRKVVEELNDSMVRVQAEKDLQREAINEVGENLNIDKRLIRKIARVYYKANFNKEVADFNDFETYYEMVMKA